MDETRRDMLLAELDDAKKERAQLDSFIIVLSARLGITDDEPTNGSDASAGRVEVDASGLPLTNDAASLVYVNEFYGKTIPAAAEDVLRRWSPKPYQRPLKTPDLLAALRIGGLEIAESRVVYKSLYPSSRFHNLKGGQWGLAEWYPASVRSKGKAAATEAQPDAVGYPSSNDADAPAPEPLSSAEEGTVRSEEAAS